MKTPKPATRKSAAKKPVARSQRSRASTPAASSSVVDNRAGTVFIGYVEAWQSSLDR